VKLSDCFGASATVDRLLQTSALAVTGQKDRHPEFPSMRARRLQRPNRGEGPFACQVNTRSLRAARPLICPFSPKAGENGALKTRASLTPFEMTLGMM
jgi:hypothetical protein